MKARNEELMSAKARLSDEVESLLSKVASFGECPVMYLMHVLYMWCCFSIWLPAESIRDEHASLKAQAESLIFVSCKIRPYIHLYVHCPHIHTHAHTHTRTHTHTYTHTHIHTHTHTHTPSQEHGENEKRVQELLAHNAQLEVERAKRLELHTPPLMGTCPSVSIYLSPHHPSTPQQ